MADMTVKTAWKVYGLTSAEALAKRIKYAKSKGELKQEIGHYMASPFSHDTAVVLGLTVVGETPEETTTPAPERVVAPPPPPVVPPRPKPKPPPQGHYTEHAPKEANATRGNIGEFIGKFIGVVFSDFNIPKATLLLFQAYVFACFAKYLFREKSKLLGMEFEPPILFLVAVGLFVDSAGFAIARKVDPPTGRVYSWLDDERKLWLFGFFAIQIALDICFIFLKRGNVAETLGLIFAVIAVAFALAGYSRSDFKRVLDSLLAAGDQK